MYKTQLFTFILFLISFTASAQVNLDIEGKIKSNSLTGIGLRMVVANDVGELSVQPVSFGNYWSKNGASLYYNSGNVGVGVADPDSKLEIKSDVFYHLTLSGIGSAATSFLMKGRDAANGYAGYEWVSHAAPDHMLSLNFIDINPPSTSFVPIVDFDTDNGTIFSQNIFAPRMLLGDGTVLKNDFDYLFISDENAAPFSSDYGIHVDIFNGYYAIAAHGFGYTNGIEGYSDSSIAAYFYAGYPDQGGRALITGAGRVGIGESDPEGKTEIKTFSSERNLILSKPGGSASLFIRSYDSGQDFRGYELLATEPNVGGLRIAYQDYQGGPFPVSSTQLVADIGKSNNSLTEFYQTVEASKFLTGNMDIEGDAANSNLKLDGDIVPFGGSFSLFDLGNNTATEHWDDVVANAFIPFSDRKVKKNISPLTYGLKEILQLQPVSYNYTYDHPEKKNRLGMIAQEVQPIIPEIIKTHDFDADENGNIVKQEVEILGMNYMELTPVLIKAMQEMHAQWMESNAELKAEIEALKAENAALKKARKR